MGIFSLERVEPNAYFCVMKPIILSLLSVLIPFNALAVSLEVADLPRAVRSKTNGPDIGLVPTAMKLRYGKTATMV